MRVALFGGSGATGRMVLARLLEQGHDVRALVRPGSSLGSRHERLAVVEGDAADPAGALEALRGQEAALLLLGTNDRHDEHSVAEATRCVVESMQRLRVPRLVAATWGGLAAAPGWITESVLLPLRWKAYLRDALTQEGYIQNSALEWTIVRPFLLTKGPATETPKVAPVLSAPLFGRTTSRADLAAYVCAQLASRDALNQVVVLASRGF